MSSPTPTAREAREADGPQRPPAVHVRFSASVGQRLRRPEPTTCSDGRALWTERPILMERADGTYELIGTSRNLEGLARWVLSFGASAEVQGPDRLKRQVAAEARRVWRQHATT